MSTGLLLPETPRTTTAAPPLRSGPGGNVWRAPLVPVALAATAGLVVDRYGDIPLPFALLAGVAALAAWAILSGRRSGLSLLYLALAVAFLSAAYHHGHRDAYPSDDLGNFATPEPRPTFLRGVLEEEPAIVWQTAPDPLRSVDRPDTTTGVLRVTAMRDRDDWSPASGRARLVLGAAAPELHVGDEVEVAGRLVAPPGPANPGEFDYAGYLRDQRVRALVIVRKTPDGVRRVAEGWRWTPAGWLAMLRGWGQRALAAALPPETAGVAAALLLGEGSGMTGPEWDKYIRTGVIHVLAISGQHLVILAGFLWFVFRLLGVRRRPGACFVALFLFGYALLAGGRPPVMRSAVTVVAGCGALLLRRPALPANLFALAWLVVLLLSPTDPFTSGCQLSFLAVAVLYWGTNGWSRATSDPLERLVEESRPGVERLLRWLVRTTALTYAVTLAVWLAAAPLVASRYHLVSPIGILVGPPTGTTLLSSKSGRM